MSTIRGLRLSISSALFASAALTATLAAGTASADPPDSPPGFGGIPVGPGLYHLNGADPSQPADDLAPLHEIVGNATYVGVGEPIHTSGGIYEMKHRLIRYLVQEMGFRALAFESPWINADRVAHYVDTCEGTPESALNSLFSVWRSTETADLLRWMCQWNTDHPSDRVHFYGIDIQRQAAPDAQALIAFLEDLGVSPEDPWISGIRACDGVDETFYPSRPFPDERYARCQDALSDVGDYLDDHENQIENATSKEALAWARIHLVGEQRGQEYTHYLASDFVPAFAARDAGMAYMVEAIHALRAPHARTIVWAHNGHVIHNPYDALQLVGMGGFLTASLGDHYRVIGITAGVVEANWPAAGYCGPVAFGGTAPVEQALGAVGQGDLLVDMNPRGAFQSFIDPSHPYSVGDFYETSINANYDALVYLTTSPRMHSLSWPICSSP